MGKHKIVLYGKEQYETFKKLPWKKKITERSYKDKTYHGYVFLPWTVEKVIKENSVGILSAMKKIGMVV